MQLFGEPLHYCSRFVVIEVLHFIQWTVWQNTVPETGCLAWKIKGSLSSHCNSNYLLPHILLQNTRLGWKYEQSELSKHEQASTHHSQQDPSAKTFNKILSCTSSVINCDFSSGGIMFTPSVITSDLFWNLTQGKWVVIVKGAIKLV